MSSSCRKRCRRGLSIESRFSRLTLRLVCDRSACDRDEFQDELERGNPIAREAARRGRSGRRPLRGGRQARGRRDRLALAARLRAVQRLVRPLEERSRRRRRRAARRCRPTAAAAPRRRSPSPWRVRAAGRGPRRRPSRLGKDHRELVAADAAGDVGSADDAANALCRFRRARSRRRDARLDR